MKIYLHVGVHKTATTYMQRQLHKNWRVLTRKGIGYMPLGRFRSFMTRDLATFVPGEFDIEGHAGNFFFDGKPRALNRLIISDENLVGSCGTLLGSGVPFKGAVGSLGRVRALFPDAEITLYCSIRAYETFLPSAYCEAVRSSRTFVKFDKFKEQVDFERLRWPRVISSFVTALQPKKTKIWKYEIFRERSRAILKDLSFGVELPRVAENSTERPSFSQATVDLLGHIADLKGYEVANQLILPIGSSLTKSAGYGQFDPWSDAERAQLAECYDQDCRGIRPHLWMRAALDQPPVRGGPPASLPPRLDV